MKEGFRKFGIANATWLQTLYASALDSVCRIHINTISWAHTDDDSQKNVYEDDEGVLLARHARHAGNVAVAGGALAAEHPATLIRVSTQRQLVPAYFGG